MGSSHQESPRTTSSSLPGGRRVILVDCLVKEFLVKSLKLVTAAPVASGAHTNTLDSQVGSVVAIGPKLQPALAGYLDFNVVAYLEED